MKISVRSIIRWTLVTCLFTGTFSFIGWAQNPPAAQAAISGVIAAGAKVELVRGGLKGAEGPVAIPDGGLYFSDITANRTYRLDKNGGISVWRENTKGTNGLFLSKDGRLLGARGWFEDHCRDPRQSRHSACDGIRRQVLAITQRPHHGQEWGHLLHRSRATALAGRCSQG